MISGPIKLIQDPSTMKRVKTGYPRKIASSKTGRSKVGGEIGGMPEVIPDRPGQGAVVSFILFLRQSHFLDGK